MCTVNPCELLHPQREKSIPVVLPSKPGIELRRGWQICAEGPALSPPGHINPNQGPDPDVKVHGQSKSCSGSTERRGSGRSRGTSPRRNSISVAGKSRKRENFKVHFDDIPKQASQGTKEDHCPRISGAERPLHMYKHAPPRPSEPGSDGGKRPTELNATPRRAESGGSDLVLAQEGVELRNGLSKRERVLQGSASHLLPRPPAPSRLHLPDRRGEAGALTLLELQDSFSRSAAHRSFNSCTAGATVGLKDSVATGRKHSFFGINCYYLRG